MCVCVFVFFFVCVSVCVCVCVVQGGTDQLCSRSHAARKQERPVCVCVCVCVIQGGTDLLGHNGAITCGDWSQDSTMVLTASADRYVCVCVCVCVCVLFPC